jgi:translocation and assembly module TamA
VTFTATLRTLAGAVALAAWPVAIGTAQAFDALDFRVTGGDDDLAEALRRASVLVPTAADPANDAQDLLAAARGEYARIVGALYATGRYSGVVRVLVDGREAATIPPLDMPDRIGRIEVIVDPGPVFRFSRAVVAPLAEGTSLPAGFATGEVAESGLVQRATTAGVNGWRDVGHAKADVAGDRIIADHPAAALSAEVALIPGPRLRFGRLDVQGEERMRAGAIRRIAGLPEGEVYSPQELDDAAARLRRTGVFRSVSMQEAEAIRAPDLLDIAAVVVEEPLRRLTFGAEIASLEGLNLQASWLHRNLFGGAERLRIAGEVSNIGAQSSGMDYLLGVTLDRPASFTPDTSAGLALDLGHFDEEDYNADFFVFGFNLSHVFSDTLTVRAGLDYQWIQGEDDFGRFRYRNVGLPLGLTWDRRDNATDATSGFYLDAEARPFYGLGSTDSGIRMTFDGRAYRGFGEEARFVLAGRLQGGALLGADLLAAPRDSLFYSGGGGSVRGQPFQSLGVTVPDAAGNSITTGGTRYLAASVEGRFRITETIGAVAFIDAGTVSDDTFARDGDDVHAGAGLGLRYLTGFGPIRLDVAAPVAGDTGDGVQIYIGIGQAF